MPPPSPTAGLCVCVCRLSTYEHSSNYPLLLPLPLPVLPPSAGVGRTGTFIALDHLVHQVQTEGEDALVDIPALVSTLRTQRGTMVQASVSWMWGAGLGMGGGR